MCRVGMIVCVSMLCDFALFHMCCSSLLAFCGFGFCGFALRVDVLVLYCSCAFCCVVLCCVVCCCVVLLWHYCVRYVL